jgi:uncharacterized protein (DUF1015 family)
MATIEPFAALRPKPELAAQICELPYDVMSSAEARAVAAGNPLSFLHVSKPEIDLPDLTDPYAPTVYAKGRESFHRLIAQGALQQDARPGFYLYRQIMGRHSQIGLVAVVSCEEYLQGSIKRHEVTLPAKEDDRLRHIEALEAQTGPAFLIYPAVRALDDFVARTIAGKPAVEFTAPDGVQHAAWTIGDPAAIEFVRNEFARIPFLYIADGHHRSAAAARVCLKRRARKPAQGPESDAPPRGGGRSAFFLSVLFPHDQLQVLPYNRVLADLNGLRPEQLLAKLKGVVTITAPGAAAPARKHELGLYLGGQWHALHFLPRFTAASNPVEGLDVTLLQKQVLEPIFGIADPRTSGRIGFVGGIRGIGELERLVNSGKYACAFSLFPTSVQDLMTIADAGGVMPPKSTWFEPKLRDGLFCHRI